MRRGTQFSGRYQQGQCLGACMCTGLKYVSSRDRPQLWSQDGYPQARDIRRKDGSKWVAWVVWVEGCWYFKPQVLADVTFGWHSAPKWYLNWIQRLPALIGFFWHISELWISMDILNAVSLHFQHWPQQVTSIAEAWPEEGRSKPQDFTAAFSLRQKGLELFTSKEVRRWESQNHAVWLFLQNTCNSTSSQTSPEFFGTSCGLTCPKLISWHFTCVALLGIFSHIFVHLLVLAIHRRRRCQRRWQSEEAATERREGTWCRKTTWKVIDS